MHICTEQTATEQVDSRIQHQRSTYMLVYAGILLGGLAGGNFGMFVSSMGGNVAGNKLFTKMLQTVVRSPTRFFDQTPTGRILNRFTKDVETVDSTLSGNIRMVSCSPPPRSSAVATIVFTIPTSAPLLLLLTYAYYRTAISYMSAARDLRRLESVTRSPIFQSFSEVLNGFGTVRAFGAQDRFLETLFRRLDATQSCYNLFWMANRWLMLRFDLMGAFTVFAASVLALAGGIEAGLAGIAITQAQNFVLAMYWLCRVWTGFEMDLNSVERMCEYFELPQEPPAIIEGSRPPADWPSKVDSRGIQVKDLVLKYAPDLDRCYRVSTLKLELERRWVWSAGLAQERVPSRLLSSALWSSTKGPSSLTVSTSARSASKICEAASHYPARSCPVQRYDSRKLGSVQRAHTDEECILALRRVNLRTSRSTRQRRACSQVALPLSTKIPSRSAPRSPLRPPSTPCCPPRPVRAAQCSL